MISRRNRNNELLCTGVRAIAAVDTLVDHERVIALQSSPTEHHAQWAALIEERHGVGAADVERRAADGQLRVGEAAVGAGTDERAEMDEC